MGIFDFLTRNDKLTKFAEDLTLMIIDYSLKSHKLFTNSIENSSFADIRIPESVNNSLFLEFFCFTYNMMDRSLFNMFVPSERDQVLEVVDNIAPYTFLNEINYYLQDSEIKELVNSRQIKYSHYTLKSENLSDTVFGKFGLILWERLGGENLTIIKQHCSYLIPFYTSMMLGITVLSDEHFG